MFSIPPKVSKRPACCWNFLVYWRRGQVVVTHDWHLCLLLLALGLGHLTEAVAELPADDGKGPHATSSSSLPPLSLDRPVVSPDLSCREPTRGASLLLDVEGNRSTSPADCVRFVTPLSKGAGSLGHLEASHHYSLVEVNQAIKAVRDNGDTNEKVEHEDGIEKTTSKP